jgi:hypothetical protein
MAAVLALTAASACTQDTGAAHGFETDGGTTGTGEASSTGSDSAPGTGGGSGGTSASTTGVTTDPTSTSAGTGASFDVGLMPDINVPSGCQKVDLLFVIDSTGSMGPHQQNLIDSYDGFVEGISNYFGQDRDFHIGVISTDAYKYNADACQEFGALITQVPTADYSGIDDCTPYADGSRFMTEADDLATKFPCTANVKAGGDMTPRPVRAAVAAIQPAINDVGGCNEGFVRDDALLVLVLITDSMTGDVPGADAKDTEDPTPWHPAIVDIKGGNPENAVAIGFISSGDTWCIPNGYDGYQAPNLLKFIEDFGTNGVVENVCTPDYAPPFTAAIDVVLAACAGFVPPG